MNNGLIMLENPFFKLGIDSLCLICNCKFEMDQTPHSILDKLEQTGSLMNVYDALKSISNFKEIKVQKQTAKVCDLCYTNISTVIKFCEMCNRSAFFLKSYIHYQEMNSITQSVITNSKSYIDRSMSTELKDVLNDHKEQDVKLQVWPELPTITTGDTSSSTAETKEKGYLNSQTCLEELCSNEKMLNDEVKHDVKLEGWLELPTITTGDTLNSTTETIITDTIIQDMRSTSEKEIMNNETGLEKPTLKTTAVLINNDKEKGKANYEEIIVNGVRKVKCKVCDRFYRTNYIKIHYQTHTDERPLSCEICGKTFKHASTKWSHKLTHNEIQQHVCKVCGKKFKKPRNLKEHLIVHSDERPFACEKCEKCFPSKKHLKQHMLSHLEEKRHECKVCGRKFRRTITLKEHSIVHSDKRPFVCEKCGKCFASIRYLRLHMLSH